MSISGGQPVTASWLGPANPVGSSQVWCSKVRIPHHPAHTHLAGHGHEPRRPGELLAELRRLNSGVIPFAMKIMYESVTVTAQEQHAFAQRLMAMGRRLEERSQRTAEQIERTAGDVFVTGGSNNTCL